MSIQASSNLRLLKGGLDIKLDPADSVLPDGELLIGVGYFTEDQSPDFRRELMAIHTSFYHLPGRAVGILKAKFSDFEASYKKRGLHRILIPRLLSRSKVQAILVKASLFERFVMIQDIFLQPAKRQEALFELCLLADRIGCLAAKRRGGDITSAQQEALERLSLDLAADNVCESCGGNISRTTFELQGPQTRVCWGCSPQLPCDDPE